MAAEVKLVTVVNPPVKVDPDIKSHMYRTYVSLRRLIAAVTFVLLAILLAYKAYGDDPVPRTSVSAYYHHDNKGVRMSDVFVAALATIGFLLIAYQGYTDYERWVLNVAGGALLSVVAFPMDWPIDDKTFWPTTFIGWLHVFAAVTFFLSIAYVCLFRARDTLGETQKGNPIGKTVYTGLYWGIGVLLILTPLLALLFGHFRASSGTPSGDSSLKSMTAYWVEVSGVFVFLSYWVVKSIELEWAGQETEQGVNALAADAVKQEKPPA